MIDQSRPRYRRGPYVLPALAPALLAPQAEHALAQPELDAARGCTVVRNQRDRLRCYDRALRDGARAGDEARAGEAAPAEAPARAAAEPARPADAAPAAPSTRERAPGAREPAPARSVTIDAPPRAPAPAAAD